MLMDKYKKDIIGPLTRSLGAALRPILERINERLTALESGASSGTRSVDLEMRVRALEDRPTMHYKGVWLEGTTYAPGSVVTSGGSMWFANVSTRSEPGKGHSRDWTLCVKRGREGRPRWEK